jgi:hypothetical protein
MAELHELSAETARDAADGGAGGLEALDDLDTPPATPRPPDNATARPPDNPNPQPPAAADDGGAGGYEALDDPDAMPASPAALDDPEPQVPDEPVPDGPEPQVPTETGDELPVPEPGTPVYRVWGRPEFPIPTPDPERPDQEGSGPWSNYWTPVDPASIPDLRSGMGLPDQNTGAFVSEGVLRDDDGVLVRPAAALDGNPGGVTEFFVPDPEKQIELQRVSGLNPNA